MNFHPLIRDINRNFSYVLGKVFKSETLKE